MRFMPPPSGEIFDYATGVEDLIAGRVRFVGDARTRIAEDYLRVLRLFRFHAWYGKGDLDGEALRAAAEAKGKLKTLSAERIAKELLRLLEARQSGAGAAGDGGDRHPVRAAARRAAAAAPGAADRDRGRQSLCP